MEINGKSRHWLIFTCHSSFKNTNDMILINLNCTLFDNVNTIKIPEESTVQCVKTVSDPKVRKVVALFFNDRNSD